MSRIGKQPIEVPANVEFVVEASTVNVKGSLGSLSYTLPSVISVKKNENSQWIVYPLEDSRSSRALHGLARTLVNNMVVGVSTGFTKDLELIGVGYKASVQGSNLVLALGYSHPVEIEIPQGVDVKVDANTKISIKGASKQQIGDLAAFIRSKRPPEPYKGKGVRYKGEVIMKKAGKSGKK